MEKYGLALKDQWGDTKLYSRNFGNFCIELQVGFVLYTLSLVENNRKKSKTIIAKMYKCDTQEQLDFLIFGGMVGHVFNVNQ